jgi:hypothetical protein
MHVPAYRPGELGVHAIENSGVTVEVKNVIDMESILIIVVVEDDMSMVFVGALDMDIVMPGIDVLLMSIDMMISSKQSRVEM